MGKKARSGIRDENPRSYFRELRINLLGLKIRRCGSGSGILFTLDPGWKKLGSGINIPDPQHWYLFCSAGGQTPLARLSGTDFFIIGSDKEDLDPDSQR
jgi:hypothetical protein